MILSLHDKIALKEFLIEVFSLDQLALVAEQLFPEFSADLLEENAQNEMAFALINHAMKEKQLPRLLAYLEREHTERYAIYAAGAAHIGEQVDAIWSDVQPAIGQYEELVKAHKFDQAYKLFFDQLMNVLYFQLGAYQTVVELLRGLFPLGEGQPSWVSGKRAQADVLNLLGSCYSFLGESAVALSLFKQHVEMREELVHKGNLSVGLGNLADEQLHRGQFAAAAKNLRRRIALCEEIEDPLGEALGHLEHGRLLMLVGQEGAASAARERALELFIKNNHLQGQSHVALYEAEAAILAGDEEAAVVAAHNTLYFVEEDSRMRSAFARDYVRAYWIFGWAALIGDFIPQAQIYLDEALRRCRKINLVQEEPIILLAHARLAHARGQAAASERLAEEAQQIAERAGYVLDLADIHNHLALLALEAGDRQAAQQHAHQGYEYAYCDGPPYAYQSALDEATRLLGLAGSQ